MTKDELSAASWTALAGFAIALGAVLLGMIGHSAKSADWNIQAGWWLNGRESRLQRLGPRLLPKK